MADLLLGDLTRHQTFAERYRVEREVARGGMGVILEVWDRKLHRRMAMKVMVAGEERGSADAASVAEHSPRVLSRFLEEAQITGQLDHPGIVPVHEMGIDDGGRVFFTMKLVRGRDFKVVLEQVREGADGWTQPRALGVILKVCEAMAFAHAKGVVHRDLKPSNVMVGRFGETYVMDWGLAKVLGREDRHDLRLADRSAPLSVVRSRRAEDTPDSPLVTVDGDVVGTPSYMAPEQALGVLEEVGPRSDVYAAGCLLYHLLTGRPPYTPPEGKISATTVLRLLIDGPPTPVQQLARDVPPELAAVCEKAMAREPDRRYESMEAMAGDLRAFLENRVVKAYRQGALAEFGKWVARNRGAAAGIGASLVLALGGLAGVAAVQQRARSSLEVAHEEVARRALEAERARERADGAAAQARSEQARADENARRALAEKERADANAAEAERETYAARLMAAAASLRVNDLAEAERRLQDCPERLRGWEWRHLAAQLDTSLRVLEGHDAPVVAVALDERARRVASADADGRVLVHALPGGEELAHLAWTDERPAGLALRPGSSELAVASTAGRVRVWDLDPPRVVREWAAWTTPEGALDPSGGAAPLAYSSDGAWLVGRTVAEWRDQGSRTSPSHALAVWDADTGDVLHVLEPTFSATSALAVAPDDAWLASTDVQGILRQWNTRTWRETSHAAFPLPGATGVGYGARGRRIVTSSQDGAARVWSVGRLQAVADLAGHDGAAVAAVFVHDDQDVLTAGADGTLRRWDARSGEPRGVLRGHRRALTSLAASPGGRLVVTGSEDETVRVWDPAAPGAEIRLHQAASIVGRDMPVRFLLPLGGRRAFVGGEVSTAAVVDLDRVDLPRPLPGCLSDANAGAVSPDGRHVAAALVDGSILVWALASGRLLQVLRTTPEGRPDAAGGDNDPVDALAASPDGSTWAAGSRSGAVELWDARAGTLRATLEGHEARVAALAYGADGAWLASGGWDRDVIVWDPASGEERARLSARDARGSVLDLAVSPDGRWLAAAHARLVLPGIVFHPAEIALWSTETWTLERLLVGHSDDVAALSFSPDGGRLASASADRTVRLWDPASGDQVFVLRGLEAAPTVLAWEPDGRRLLAGDADNAVRVWSDEPLARGLAGRELGSVELARGELPGRVDRWIVVGSLQEEIQPGRAAAQQLAFVSARDALLLEELLAFATFPRGGRERAALVLPWVEQCRKRSPEDVRGWELVLALAHLRMDDPAGALSELEQAPSAGAEEQAVAAMAHHALGQREAAERALNAMRTSLAGMDEDQREAASVLTAEAERALAD